MSSWVLAHTCTTIDANGQAMRMVRRREWSCGLRILRKEFLANPYATTRSAQRNPPAAHLHAKFSDQRKHGQMNNVQNRGTILQSKIPRASLCLKLRFLGACCAFCCPTPLPRAHEYQHAKGGIHLPKGDYCDCVPSNSACFSWAISSSERGLSSSIYCNIPLPASCNVSARARKEWSGGQLAVGAVLPSQLQRENFASKHFP